MFGLRGKRESMQRRREAGQTLALVSFGLFVFISAAGLAVDMGFLRYQKRMMQAAADGAALAAATDLNLALTSIGTARLDARAVALVNGFQDGVNNTNVNVNLAPGVTPSQAVEVDIERVYPNVFAAIAGFPSSTISATATATIGTSSGCMYALGVGGAGVTLDADVAAPNCGIVSNGPLSGSGNINSPSIGVYGGSGGYGGVPASSIGAIPQPAADPLAYLTPPGVGGCIGDPMVAGVATLSPGCFQGITILAGAAVTFNPGLYILTGSTGLQIMGSATATSGPGGVTFYNTGSGAITFSGTGAVTLSASTSIVGGLPPGILFYQDPGNTAAADVSEAASGNVFLNGTLYFPGADLTVAGSVGGTNALTVAQSITLTGSTALAADSTTVIGGSPLQNVSLVE